MKKKFICIMLMVMIIVNITISANASSKNSYLNGILTAKQAPEIVWWTKGFYYEAYEEIKGEQVTNKTKLEYPQFRNIPNKDAENKINSKLEEIAKIWNYYEWDLDNMWHLSLEYSVKFCNSKMISVTYHYMRALPYMGRFQHIYNTLNFNVETGDQILLTDIMDVSEDFIALMYSENIFDKYATLTIDGCPFIFQHIKLSYDEIIDGIGGLPEKLPESYLDSCTYYYLTYSGKLGFIFTGDRTTMLEIPLEELMGYMK